MTRVFKPDSGQPLEIQHAGGSAALTVETDGDIALTQDIYLAAGKGIYFDGGTTSANYLGGSDAYEEGYFIATMTPGSGTITLAGAGRRLSYTRIGRLVYISGRVSVDSVSTPSGDLKLEGLPYVVDNNSHGDESGFSCVSIWVYDLTGATAGNIQTLCVAGGEYIRIDDFNGTTAVNDLANHIQAGTYFGFGGAYVAA